MGKTRQQVALHDIRMFAYHGFYPQEQRMGAVFYLDIEAEFDLDEDQADELANVLNYERLFTFAKTAMQKPRKLIETVAQEILDQLLQEFSQIDSARVSIRKMNPPLSGEVGNAQVTLSFTR